MKNAEETVIITVSLLGMAESGTGTQSFTLDLTKPQEAVGIMYEAIHTAVADAMGDLFPHFQNYTREKYAGQEVDNEDDT